MQQQFQNLKIENRDTSILAQQQTQQLQYQEINNLFSQNENEGIKEQDQKYKEQEEEIFELQLCIQQIWKDRYRNISIKFDDFEEQIDILKKRILQALSISKKRIGNYEFKIQTIDGQFLILDNLEDFFFILEEFNYSEESRINIALNQYGEYQSNLEAKQIIKKQKIEKQQTKKKKKLEELKQHIKFTETGQVIEQSCKKFELNRPDDELYLGKEEVECSFCRINSGDIQTIQKAGPIYGPFNYKKKKHYVHLMCSIWTPNVYLDEKTNKFKNLKNEIQRSNKVLCDFCSTRGGGLGCVIKNCKASFHYVCGINSDSKCKLDRENYTLYCSDHQAEYDREIEKQLQEEADSDDDMESSMNITEQQGTSNNNNYSKYENMLCSICKNEDEGDENDDKIIICDDCDQGFHIYCLDPPLESIPKDEWYCQKCVRTIYQKKK